MLHTSDPITPVHHTPIHDFYSQYDVNHKIHNELLNSYKDYNFDLFQYCDTIPQQGQLFMDYSCIIFQKFK